MSAGLQVVDASYSRPGEARVVHWDLDATIDFDTQHIVGHVDLRIVVANDAARVLVLDTNHLVVSSVVDPGCAEGCASADLKWEMSDNHAVFGRALVIHLPPIFCHAGDTVCVRVAYRTTSTGTALQWLAPEQTAGRQHAFLFSQCQAIHARSLVPCQDTPSVKSSYTATLRVPKPLVPVMSALRDPAVSDTPDGKHRVFKFRQERVIPSYLVALAAGNLASRDVGPRSAVWSEPETLEAGAYEFAETEKFLQIAEDLCGPYVWGRYDILLLPPSFPYGGMENPGMTFVTPTLLAGDRSLANVVAHEIAHSWTGNLVTNASWAHFWLNEGFTVFVERKILGRFTNSKAQEDLAALIGMDDLERSVAAFGQDGKHPFTCLVPDLTGIDPDDAFSSVPYEKGYNFLRHLEEKAGGASAFEPFLKAWIQDHALKTAVTSEFKAYYTKAFPAAVVDWDAWTTQPGMPPVANTFDRSLLQQCEQVAAQWTAAAAAALQAWPDTAGVVAAWPSSQHIVMLNQLIKASPRIGEAAVHAIGQAHGYAKSRNSEIRFRWLNLCIANDVQSCVDDVVAMLRGQGRMKFTRPLARLLYRTEWGRDAALATYHDMATRWHAICAKMVAADLEVAPP